MNFVCKKCEATQEQIKLANIKKEILELDERRKHVEFLERCVMNCIEYYADEDEINITESAINLYEAGLREIPDDEVKEIERLKEENAKLKSENADLRERFDSSVEFPCMRGDTVFSIFEINGKKTILKGICDQIQVNFVSSVATIIIWITFEPETIIPRTRIFTDNSLNYIFRTKEAAEARLKELQEKEK